MNTSRRGPARWFFDLWSRFYDIELVQRFVYRPVHDAVLETLRPLGSAAILDVGCGTGLLSARLREELPGVRVVGLDFSLGMLRQAASNDRSGAFAQGDAQRLPFRDGVFDAVVSTESFHWYPDQDAAMREFHRVLVPGGRLLVEVVTPSFEAVARAARRISQVAGEPAHWPTRAWMRERLEASGFMVESQRQVLRLPNPILFPGVVTIARRLPEGAVSSRSSRPSPSSPAAP